MAIDLGRFQLIERSSDEIEVKKNWFTKLFYWIEMTPRLFVFGICVALACGCIKQLDSTSVSNQPPPFVLGQFTDDYGISYSITNKEWLMKPGQSFEIIEWNSEHQFAIAKNHSDNSSDGNRYSRIDFMLLDDEAYQWGFCFSTFDAESAQEARSVLIADRENPKTGCNGYPFSRMKPAQQD